MLISKEDFKFLRGGDRVIQTRNKHMEEFCKRYHRIGRTYGNEKNYKYYEDQAPRGQDVIISCPNGTEENPYMQSSVRGQKTKDRPNGDKYFYGHSVYPDECSPTLWTEIKINYRKLKELL